MVICGYRDTGHIPAMDISGYPASGFFRRNLVFYGHRGIGAILVVIIIFIMGIGDLMSDFMAA